ncbi:toll/interleukin-1 receptor domain-containing protein [Thiothrix subterranea]|uniref:Toll/interleukin-1 receptor domain-containing protein n=1 Tax=Thiothrix subterranea TaxID=2735563 RepID=A0AA51R5F3_9GAMM|nr:toll/interleukin-1 receptor domain-containing protein [Thiothrix subterranea]MDQ5770626.1 toll/interleukin-1 receptor domain-containing protein [Thiothrix subterranea]WML87710.1 toll/interleukin-1 receptor domain-containing protein [Thiothrix subterranea]
MTTKSVYVSYSWTAERETTPLVDELACACAEAEIDFLFDKKCLKHGDLIRSFMDELSSNGNIIPIFSQSYFESDYCMYELLSILKNGSFQHRIHPVRLDDIKRIDDPMFHLSIIGYWKNKVMMLESKLSEHDVGVTIELQRIRVVYAEIYRHSGELLSFISDMVILPLSQLRLQKFKPIIDRIIVNEKNAAKKSTDLSVSFLPDANIKFSKIKINHITKELNALKLSYDSEYKDVVSWLSKDKTILIEIIYDQLIEKVGAILNKKGSPATTSEVGLFKLDLAQYIEQLEVCLLDDDTDLLDSPHFKVNIKHEFYEMALSMLFDRVPSSVSEKSKSQLKYYMTYLIKTI